MAAAPGVNGRAGRASPIGPEQRGEEASRMPEVIFNGPEGRLEGRYHHNKRPNALLALLLHPHPQYGGTMNNRVIYHLYQAFTKRGFSTLRFNFRGVGRSQGRYDDGMGELSDAAAALDWLQSCNPDAKNCWIAGYSFGAWIGMQLLMRRPEISAFVSIAPPANMYDFSFLAPCPSSGLMVHGGKDDIVPESHVAALVKKLSSQRGIVIDYKIVPDANHYFNEKIDAVTTHVERYLDRTLSSKKVPA
jgi:alpha/beta superfamily hydrolase